MAGKPADREHPFGHGRVEYIAALLVAFLVLEVGVSFLKNSVDKILHPQEIVFQWVPFLVLLLSVSVKLWMAFFYRKLGRMIDSKVMAATAVDAAGDVMATAVTLISLAVYRLVGVNVDGYAGLVVSFFIIWAGIGIIRDTARPLVGEAADPAVYRMVTEFVESYEGICGTHDLIVHNYGPSHSMASIHAEISSEQGIVEAHELIDAIEREANRRLGIFLVIHTDPVDLNSKVTKRVRAKVAAILQELDERLSIHDFRIVEEKTVTKLIFDMAVPFEFDEEREETIKKTLEESLQKENPGYRCVITYDKSFFGGEDMEQDGKDREENER